MRKLFFKFAIRNQEGPQTRPFQRFVFGVFADRKYRLSKHESQIFVPKRDTKSDTIMTCYDEFLTLVSPMTSLFGWR